MQSALCERFLPTTIIVHLHSFMRYKVQYTRTAEQLADMIGMHSDIVHS